MTAAVVVLGAVGALLRAEVGWRLRRRTGSPRAGTWTVNLVGAALLGLLLGAEAAGAVDPEVVAPLGLGLLGGFTTFSTWMVDALRLGDALRHGDGDDRRHGDGGDARDRDAGGAGDGGAGARPTVATVVGTLAGMLLLGVAAGAGGLALGRALAG